VRCFAVLLGVWVSGCLGVWVSGCLGVWASEGKLTYLDGLLNDLNSRNSASKKDKRELWISDCQICGCTSWSWPAVKDAV
jgi:hypothetical protein